METQYKEILDTLQKDLADYQNEVGIGMMDDEQWQDLFIERVIESITFYESLELHLSTLEDQVVEKFKQKYPIGSDLDVSNKIELDNQDRAVLMYNDEGDVVVENDSCTQYGLDLLSKTELQLFLDWM